MQNWMNLMDFFEN